MKLLKKCCIVLSLQLLKNQRDIGIPTWNRAHSFFWLTQSFVFHLASSWKLWQSSDSLIHLKQKEGEASGPLWVDLIKQPLRCIILIIQLPWPPWSVAFAIVSFFSLWKRNRQWIFLRCLPGSEVYLHRGGIQSPCTTYYPTYTSSYTHHCFTTCFGKWPSTSGFPLKKGDQRKRLRSRSPPWHR